ncbi:unnamed protein product [Allacma fusca]|uniref:DUF4806 domain-containing protein n=1 Tax=Allacma fusca TaxID=39272 RepID=A0A8J2JBP6_9HEXA|nr:unnamed protein product [Allacma fusca]
MADIQITQDRILAILAHQVNGDIEQFDSLPIPCGSKTSLEELEIFLHDNDNKLKLERFLASIGGATLKKPVNSILQRILADDFAVSISFSGKGKAELAFVHFDKVHHTIIRKKLKLN